MWLHLALWFSNLLRIHDRAKCGKGTEFTGGGHSTEIFVLEKGDTAHTFLRSETKRVGTPQNIERKHILGWGDTTHTLLRWGHRTTKSEKA